METPTQTETARFEGDLDTFVAAFDCVERARVVEVLKTSAFETTELVELPNSLTREQADARAQEQRADYYIRKTINFSAGAGGAYEALWRAQQQGACLTCAPRLESCTRVGDRLTVVMECVRGATLLQAVEAQGGSLSYAGAVFPLLCEAVDELHHAPAAPIIHRDLKPSNIIVSEHGPVVIDFGIAREWHDGAETDTSHFGTRCYAPPEQFGFGQTDVRSDVYALGKILYFCLTGQSPENVITAAALAEAGVGPACAKVILRATAFDPKARYATAHQLAQAARDAITLDLELQAQRDRDFAVPALVRSIRCTLSRIPDGVGVAWNVLLGISFALLALTSVVLVAVPTGRDMGAPLWFRIVEYIVFFMGIVAVVYFCLLDKRRLRRKLPALRSLTLPRQIVIAGVYAVLSFLVLAWAVWFVGV